MIRKFNSEIFIASNDSWIFQGNEIVHEDILAYFRRNLKQDEDGVYIENQFGELIEHGYLNLEGYPVHITYVSEEGGTLFFSTDASKTLCLDDVRILLTKQGQIILNEKDFDKIQYRFSRTSAVQISNWIQEHPELGENSYKLVYNNVCYTL